MHFKPLLLLAAFLSLSLAAQPKPRIAVLAFENISGGEFAREITALNAGRKVSESLLVELVRSGKFDVVEREQIEKAVKEQRFSSSGLVDPSNASEIGKISGVDYLIIGTIETNVQSKATATNNLLFIQKTNTLSMNVKIAAKLVNTTSGSVVSAEEAQGKAESKSTSNEFHKGEENKSLDVLFGEASKPALGRIASVFIPRAIELFKPATPKILVAAVDGNVLYLNAGENAGLAIGQRVQIAREGQPIIDPGTGKILKIRLTKLCEVTISSVDPTSAEATLPPASPTIQVKDVVILPAAVPPSAATPSTN